MRAVVVCLVFLLLVTVPTVSAQTQESDPGITPDSPLYLLERAWERVQMMFTFDESEKAELALQFANERIAELKAMVEAEKPEFVAELTEAYNEHMAQAKQLVQSLESGDLEAAMQAVSSMHQSVLENLSDNVPTGEIKSQIESTIQNLKALLSD